MTKNANEKKIASYQEALSQLYQNLLAADLPQKLDLIQRVIDHLKEQDPEVMGVVQRAFDVVKYHEGSNDHWCAVCGLPMPGEPVPLTGWHVGCARGDCTQKDRILSGGFKFYAPIRAAAEARMRRGAHE